MPKIPNHNYSVSELEEQKLWACTYRYEEDNKEGRYADTWHVSAKSMGEALKIVCDYCENTADFTFYQITNINLV